MAGVILSHNNLILNIILWVVGQGGEEIGKGLG